MADMGFLPQVDWVLRRIESGHQTMLFSATLDGDVNRLVKRHLRDPIFHQVSSPTTTVESMEHRFLSVHQMDKVKVAAAIASNAGKCLVFVRTKRGADRLVEQLRKEGVPAAAIHGDLRQSSRDKALEDFSKGKLPGTRCDRRRCTRPRHRRRRRRRPLRPPGGPQVLRPPVGPDRACGRQRGCRDARALGPGGRGRADPEASRTRGSDRRGVLQRSSPCGPRLVASRRGSRLKRV